jgi:hypothetical protein
MKPPEEPMVCEPERPAGLASLSTTKKPLGPGHSGRARQGLIKVITGPYRPTRIRCLRPVRDEGFVSVDHDTAQFAVISIQGSWKQPDAAL